MDQNLLNNFKKCIVKEAKKGISKINSAKKSKIPKTCLTCPCNDCEIEWSSNWHWTPKCEILKNNSGLFCSVTAT